MNKLDIRIIRTASAKWFYRFENARGKLGIVQTIILMLTFVKVYGFSDLKAFVLVVVFCLGLVFIGWLLDYTKFQHYFIQESSIRNPMAVETLDNTYKILAKLE